MSPKKKSTEEQPEQETQKQEEQPTSIKSVFYAFKGAPTPAEIEAWKAQFGGVFVFGTSEEELFVFRAVNRPQWIELQKVMAENEIDQFTFEEMVCDACVLWKSVEGTWKEGKAGTPSALFEVIMQNSNFMSPQGASLLVAKL